VYEHLGFDRYIAVDDFIDPEIRGYYVSDRTLAARILEELSTSDPGPHFIFAVSMQNHLPFDRGKYPESGIPGGKTPIPETLSEESREALEAFLIGAHDAWKAFVDVADGLKNRGRPAILVQFGDHLPGFDRVYSETGFVADRNPATWSVSERLRMHTLPVAVWDSFGSADQRFDRKETVSLSFLGSRLLAAYGLMGKNPYLVANLANSHENPVLLREFLEKPSRRLTASHASVGHTGLIAQEWRQYDGLFGRKWNLTIDTVLADIEHDIPQTDPDAT
jgi:hypothetical protein